MKHHAVNLGWFSIGTGIMAMIPIFAIYKIKKYITIVLLITYHYPL